MTKSSQLCLEEHPVNFLGEALSPLMSCRSLMVQIPLPVLPLFVTDWELAEVYLLLNMVSVKLLFLLLLFQKTQAPLAFFCCAVAK